MAAIVLQDESGMVSRDHSNRIPIIRELRSHIMNGEWEKVESILKESFQEQYPYVLSFPSREQKPLLYQVYKEIYLEYISSSEFQKALHYLFKVIKPLEEISNQCGPQEFMELCYLLTVKSVQSSSYFQHWPGVEKSREILADSLSRAFIDDKAVVEKPVLLSVHFRADSCRSTGQAPKTGLFVPNRIASSFPPFFPANFFPARRLSATRVSHGSSHVPRHASSRHSRTSSGVSSTQSVRNVDVSTHVVASKSQVFKWHTHANSRDPTLSNNGDPSPDTIVKVGDCGGLVWEVDCTWDGGVAAASSDGVVRCVIVRFMKNSYWRSVECDHVMDAISVRVLQEDVYSLKSHPFLPSTILCGGFDGSMAMVRFTDSRVVKVDLKRAFHSEFPGGRWSGDGGDGESRGNACDGGKSRRTCVGVGFGECVRGGAITAGIARSDGVRMQWLREFDGDCGSQRGG